MHKFHIIHKNLNYRSHLESTIQIPLQALIRKYPYSVISLKSRSTTGRVCPLQVSGVCRKADISVVFYFKVHFLVQLWFGIWGIIWSTNIKEQMVYASNCQNSATARTLCALRTNILELKSFSFCL